MLLLLASVGCGNTYRPVVTAINPVGPAAQPQKYAVVISQPTPTSPGLLTLVDFSGDTVLVTPYVGLAPYYLAMATPPYVPGSSSNAFTGFTLNSDSTVSSFDISPSLMTNDVQTTTLLTGASANSIFPQAASVYITEPGRSAVAQLEATPPTVRQELPINPAFSPVYAVGTAGAPRIYVVSQRRAAGNGQVAAIETTSNTVSNTVPVGLSPVYGVMTADNKRAFILNSGSNSISVINAQTNTLDVSSALPNSTIPVGVSPVWADIAPSRTELIVLNAGGGISQGSLSVVNIPLCQVTALPTNPNCDAVNPVDAVGFGQVLGTVPVGLNPQVVAVLQDGTRAYVANAGDPSRPCSAPTAADPLGNCTVSVVNLNTRTVTATIALAGHPNFIAATTGTPTGKVYVTSRDTTDLTVIRTDLDRISTTIPIQGNGIQVRVTAF